VGRFVSTEREERNEDVDFNGLECCRNRAGLAIRGRGLAGARLEDGLGGAAVSEDCLVPEVSRCGKLLRCGDCAFCKPADLLLALVEGDVEGSPADGEAVGA
jgi:hypothetical protein